jgi:hypothetical protein
MNTQTATITAVENYGPAIVAVGNALYGYELGRAPALSKGPDADGFISTITYLKENVDFKFNHGTEFWENRICPMEDVNPASADGTEYELNYAAADKKFKVATAGWYKLSINPATLVAKFETLTSLPIENLYIVGDATEAAWTAGKALEFEHLDDGSFRWRGYLTTGQFKFIDEKTFNHSICPEDGGVTFETGQEYNLKYDGQWKDIGGWDKKFTVSTAGYYSVTVTVDGFSLKAKIDVFSPDFDFIINTTRPASEYTSIYGDIIFEAGGQLTGIGNEGLTVNGLVKYRRVFTPWQWYAVGFPFAPASYPSEFGVKAYNGNAFDDSEEINAGEGYIIQFPDDFEDTEVVFTSETGVTLKNLTEDDLDAALALAESNHYYLVANPSVNNLTLSTADKYYIYNGSDSFHLLTSGTATVKPFESFVVANDVAQNLLEPYLNIDNATALEPLHLNDPVIHTEYYNLQGQKVQYPVRNSLYIVKKTHSSGQVDTVKIIK